MATKKNKFYVFNVKLQTNKSDEEKFQAYENLITGLTSVRKYTRLNKNEAITMYEPFHGSENGLKYFYGALGKGISFFDKEEIHITDKDNNISTERTNKNQIIEPIYGEYIFIPSIHRFALISKSHSISLSDFDKFLQDHLQKLVNVPDILIVDYEKDSSIIDEIFKARAIYSLSYEISYSNNDALSAQGELFDELLKVNHIGDLKVTAQSDYSTEGMNVKNVDFLGGGIEVAKKNGTIKEAIIIPNEGDKKIKISNVEKPKIQDFELLDSNDNLNLRWFLKLIKIYKAI